MNLDNFIPIVGDMTAVTGAWGSLVLTWPALVCVIGTLFGTLWAASAGLGRVVTVLVIGIVVSGLLAGGLIDLLFGNAGQPIGVTS